MPSLNFEHLIELFEQLIALLNNPILKYFGLALFFVIQLFYAEVEHFVLLLELILPLRESVNLISESVDFSFDAILANISRFPLRGLYIMIIFLFFLRSLLNRLPRGALGLTLRDDPADIAQELEDLCGITLAH